MSNATLGNLKLTHYQKGHPKWVTRCYGCEAEAMRLYLMQRDESPEAQNAAAEIKLRAERRA